MVRSSAFHIAFRVLLIGVGLSILAAAALPLLTLPSETRVAVVDRANLPAASPLGSDRPDDRRRVASADTIPGLFGEHSAAVGASERRPLAYPPVDQEGESHSRPVPPPQMAEVPFPARSSTAPPRPDGAGPTSRTWIEETEGPGITGEVPREFPTPRGQGDGDPVTLPAPLGPDLVEMRREIDRLAESHLQDQRSEIQKAQLVLSEMQNAKQIDLLRDEIRTLRDAQAEIRSTAPTRFASLPDPSPEAPLAAALPVASLALAPPVPPVPPALQIERTADPSRYTIRLRGALLGDAVNELAVLAGWNVVTGDEFSQTVTATLTDVTAEEAVEALLQAHGWEIRREGRRLLIDRASAPTPAQAAPTPVLDAPAPEAPVSAALRSETAASSTLVVESVPPPEDLQTQVFHLQHVSAAELLPHVEGLLSPGVGFASKGEPQPQEGQVATPRTDQLVVRDRAANLQQLAHAIASLDLPPRQIEIDMTILQVTLPGMTRVRPALSDFLQSHRQPDQPCPRCGRRHPAAAPAGPACTLPEPEWTLGGAGWEFAQLQGTHAEFVDTIKRFAAVEVLTRDRIRVLHQQSADVGLLNLVRRTGAAVPFPQGDAQLLNAGPALSVRPHSLEAGKTRLSITSRREGLASEVPTEPSGTDVVVQKGCSLVIAGLQATTGDRPSSPQRRGAIRTELVILLTPRPAEEAPARVTE